MGPNLPERACDYTFYTDRTTMINKRRSLIGKQPNATLGISDLYVTVYNPTTGKTYNLFDEVKDFYVKDSGGNMVFGLNNQGQYSLFMKCQAEADVDKNGTYSEEEYANFKEMLKEKVATLPNCAQIEGLYEKQEIAQTTTGNLDQKI